VSTAAVALDRVTRIYPGGVPTVLVDRCPSDRFGQVGVENVEATAGLVDHLAAIGHRRIGLVSGLPGLSTSTERIAGYRLALQRRGLRYDERLVADGHSTAASTAVAQPIHEIGDEAVRLLVDRIHDPRRPPRPAAAGRLPQSLLRLRHRPLNGPGAPQPPVPSADWKASSAPRDHWAVPAPVGRSDLVCNAKANDIR
jgi:DNA-binding LacI/PurR family transcriptional regulator